MIRILIADDHPIVRAGLKALFEPEGDMTVVAETGDAQAAVELTLSHTPDVVLMDLQFGDQHEGARAIRLIHGLAEPPNVLILTNYYYDSDILAAVEAGESGYLLKDAPPAELLIAVRAAAADESALALSRRRENSA